MKKVNIIKVIAIIILVLILIIVLSMGVKKKNSYNNVKDDNRTIITSKLSNSDLEELERFYLPIYIASNNENMKIPIVNSCIYEFNLEELSKDEYNIKDSNANKIYNKDSIDNIIKELLGDKANNILNGLDIDKNNNIYKFEENNSYIPYFTEIKDQTYKDNGDIIFDIEYFEFNESEYFKYYDTYLNDNSNTSGISQEELNDKIYKEYVKNRERKNAKITININSDYKYSQYKLVSIE